LAPEGWEKERQEKTGVGGKNVLYEGEIFSSVLRLALL